MTMLDEEKADVTTLDAGDVFLGGRYHSLVAIAQETYSGNSKHFYATAVVKKGTLPDVTNIRHLRGKKICFPGVGSLAGWIIPIYEVPYIERNFKALLCESFSMNKNIVYAIYLLLYFF